MTKSRYSDLNTEKISMLIDGKLTNKECKNFYLNVHLTNNSFSYTIFDPKTRFFLELFDYHDEISFDLEKVISKLKLDISSFKAVKVMVSSVQQTLVPSSLFDKAQVKSYADISFGKRCGPLIINNAINKEAKLIFSIHVDFFRKIEKIFPYASIYHEGVPLLEGLLFNQSNGYLLHISISSEIVGIVFLKDGKLQLYNCFEHTNDYDPIYFSLFVCKRLNIDTHLINVELSGLIDSCSNCLISLNKHFKHVNYAALPKAYYFKETFGTLSQHSYYNSFNLSLCE